MPVNTYTQPMKIIADSSSTRTEWVMLEGNDVVEHAFTSGLNPYFLTRREISHSIRLELPESFFRRRWEHVYFYGAGCGNLDKCKVLESSLVAQFKTPVTVKSDLMGAARGLLVRKPGLVAILGTGSNSCLYDGETILRNVAPLGFILGDEGSGAYLGKQFVADVLRGIAPKALGEEFMKQFSLGYALLMNEVYSNPLPNRSLTKYAQFLVNRTDDPYVYKLIYDSFMRYFERNIALYGPLDYPLHCVGSTAVAFQDILLKAAADSHINIAKIVPNSMPGLIEFHTTK